MTNCTLLFFCLDAAPITTEEPMTNCVLVFFCLGAAPITTEEPMINCVLIFSVHVRLLLPPRSQ